MKITVVGDIFLGALPNHIGGGVNGSYIKDALKASDVPVLFKDTDIVFGNLESPVFKDEEKALRYPFAGSKRFVAELASSGLNAVSIANNHIGEHGRAGIFETREILESTGIRCIEHYGTWERNTCRINIRGLIVSFAAFNMIPGKNLERIDSESDIFASVRQIKSEQQDFIIASLHWGNEYVPIPSFTQVKLARTLIDEGVHVIIGHHPHVLQPIEEYKHGLIIYSLGNFIFDMIYTENVRIGVVVRMEIKNSGEIKYDTIYTRIQANYFPRIIDEAGQQIRKLRSYEKMMASMLACGQGEYENKYQKMRVRGRRRQRILMKKDFFYGLMKNPTSTLKHISNKYYAK